MQAPRADVLRPLVDERRKLGDELHGLVGERELDALGQDEFVRILTEPRSALIKQYTALMATEGVDLQFSEDGVAAIAEFAAVVNERTENIGARRLHTVMERLLDEVSFDAPNLTDKTISIDAAYVRRMLADIVKNEDLSRYIL